MILENKKICLLGLGIENYSLLQFLLKQKIDCSITICDGREKKELKERLKKVSGKISLLCGKDYDKNLAQFDVIFRSPGYPLFKPEIVKAKKSGVAITSPMRLFFELSPAKNIIGVTGSKGKGTTSSLIYAILKKAGHNVYLGGNIGVAPFDFIDKLRPSSLVVLELSSFQLEDFDASPKIAVVTNIFREHLSAADVVNPNYHQTFKAYQDAKVNIFKYQGNKDYLVINEKLSSTFSGYLKRINGKKIFYSQSNLASKLPGEHNKENIAAAVEVAKILKIKSEIVKKAVNNFKGLPHRIEKVAQINKVTYYDDSFATTPESSIIALESFTEPIVLLAGGADKGADFKLFKQEITRRVKFLILFKGKGTEKLKKSLKMPKGSIKEVSSMPAAIKLAKKVAQAGDVVLLSTGCASFGVFKNYKERGDLFKKEVLK